jgi:hypothetical protein
MKNTQIGLLLLAAGAFAYAAGNKKPQTKREQNLQKFGFISALLGAGVILFANKKVTA